MWAAVCSIEQKTYNDGGNSSRGIDVIRSAAHENCFSCSCLGNVIVAIEDKTGSRVPYTDLQT